MNRAPGFMLYAQKAIAGSLHLSGEAFKAYWLMLFWMWANSTDYCSMPDTDTAWHRATMIDDPDKLAEAKAEIMNPEWPLLKKTRNRLVSNGLKKEAKKQKNKRGKASNAGLQSGKARRDKALRAEQTLNERSSGVEPPANITVTDTVTDTITKEKKPLNPDAVQLSQFLLDCIRETRPDFKQPKIDTWAVHADRMLRLDERDLNEVLEIIGWVHGSTVVCVDPHDFWSTNILSVQKLRKQYDQLKGQWKQEQRPIIEKKEQDEKRAAERVVAEKQEAQDAKRRSAEAAVHNEEMRKRVKAGEGTRLEEKMVAALDRVDAALSKEPGFTKTGEPLEGE